MHHIYKGAHNAAAIFMKVSGKKFEVILLNLFFEIDLEY